MNTDLNPNERIQLIINQINAEMNSVEKININSKPTQNSLKEIKTINLNTETEEAKRCNFYKQRALQAYRQKKIFSMNGNYITVRKALIQRGWIEKCSSERLKKLERLSMMSLLKASKKSSDCEVALLSKLVQSYPPNLIWQPKYFKDQYESLSPFRNRVRRTRCMDFSTKVGLIGCLENAHWHTIKDVAEVNVTPSYNLGIKENELGFVKDFRLTQCLSLLVFLLESEKPSNFFDKSGVVPLNVIEFSLNNIENFCKSLDQTDVESVLNNQDQNQWEEFTQNSGQILKASKKFNGSEEDCSNFLKKMKEVIQKIQEVRPFLFSYGHRNLWIMKPGFQSRGQGIVILDTCKKILNYAAERTKANYVVQKYIEKPLLIYKTKFDIRQYMFLTIFDTISIWIYKDCYLRFSSREFTLDDLGEAIHLTNNSVQKKYKNGERDSRLPVHNMWSLSEFQAYLKSLNQAEAWDDRIYPSFKKNLISIVLSSLEETDLKPNTFELYGCDFMLDEKLNPFLIEINSTPDLSPSTPVTAKICRAVQEDVLKILFDKFKNSTGNFELIYQIPNTTPQNIEAEVMIEGTPKKIHAPISISRKMKVKKFIKRKILRKRSLVTKTSQIES